MDPSLLVIGILLVGMIVVVGGILAFRLDPFLALILGSLAVASLTPVANRQRFALEKSRLRVVSTQDRGTRFEIAAGTSQGLRPGTLLLLLTAASESEPLTESAELVVESAERQRCMAVLQAGQPVAVDQPFLVISHDGYRAALKQAGLPVMTRITKGFGETCASIGILIAMASIIGKCLLDSGSAERIVRFALGICGQKGAAVAFVVSGFVLAIPVFFDTVFYLMVPLAKTMRVRTGRSYLFYILAIFAGGTMAHSLVPPTPGPLFVAEALGVELGLMMLAGCLVGLFSSSAGYLCAWWCDRHFDVPLRESVETSLAELTKSVEQRDEELPSIGIALLPILLPVLLIGGQAVLPYFPGPLPPSATFVFSTLGDKNLALILAAFLALGILVRQRGLSLSALKPAVQSSLTGAGSIMLITAAGGAFGSVLQETGVSLLIRELPVASPPVIIALAFLVTAAIRTAQGSATVAMITAVGVLGGLATSGDLPFHPVYLALAIGCGSKPVSWMNDSGFWVISRMSGMTEAETLRTVTPISGVMGVVGLIVTLIGAWLFPLV